MTKFIVENWGNVASVVGLVFSTLAFIFSKRASTAAGQARNAALRRSLAEKMNGASRLAREIVTYVGLERGGMALLRVGELIDRTSYLVARWETRLHEKSRNNLLIARQQLQIAHGVLSKTEKIDLTPKARRDLSDACQRVSAIFSEEHDAAVMGSEVD